MSDMLKEIEEWFTERPRWVQDAARRIIQNGGITDADLAELVTLCKVEGGACASSTIKPKSIPAGSLVSKEQKVNLRLNAIMNVKGINALAPRKPLLLGDEPLTIIYGQNGSGKSGYVRVLKHACGARKPGKLLGNVFEKSTTETGCTFRITNDSGTKDIDWKPSIGVHEDLSSIEIYDSDCATAYVSQENEVAYEPWILSLFSQLIEVCLKVGQVIKDEIGLKVSTKPILPVNLSATKTGTWYNTLNHKTKDSEIDEQCDWTPDLEKELVQIKQRLAESNPADKAKALRKTIFNAQNLIQTLKNLTDNLQEEKCATYILAKDNALVKRKAADEDAKKVFEGSSVDGVGTESWKLLWEQARKYSNEVAYPQQTFPNVEDNARCVLCHQLLSNEAKIRLESFEKFVQGGLQKEAKEAEQYLETLTNNLGEIPNGEHLNLLMDSSGITDELVRDNIMDFCTALQKRKDSLINAKNTEDLFPLPAKEKLEGLANLIETLEQQAAAFDEDAKSDNRELLVIRHNELEAKKWVSQQRTSIKDEVERLKLVQQLKQSLNLTNTQSLSAKKSSLSNVLITDEYVRRFERELKELGAARIRVQIVKTKVQKGHIYHQIQLKGSLETISTSEVLSEGESRIVSLAGFLADVEGRDNNAPFIFDDPISSLDQNFEEATVNRLVKLCDVRQVIVFTHRLSMLTLLQDAAKKKGLKTNVICLRAEKWGTGEPGDTPIYADKPRKAFNKLLNDRLTEAENVLYDSGQEEYDKLCKGICSDFRIILERLIEMDMLADVVRRFRRSVITKDKLHQLAKIKLEDCLLIDDLMTKYSRYEHSQPDESPVPLPEPDEIKEDIKKVLEWLEEFSKRKTA